MPNVTREKLLNLLLYKKRARKMLMKLTQGISGLAAAKCCFKSYKISNNILVRPLNKTKPSIDRKVIKILIKN